MDQEHAIADFLQGAITNAEQEKLVKDLYEKSMGLDFVKPKFQAFQDKYTTLEKQHTQLNSGLSRLSEMVNKNDFRGFFQALKIPREKIFEYALNELNYDGLPPEQKSQIERQRQMEQQLAQTQQYASQMQAQHEQMMATAMSHQIDQSLARDEVKQVSEAFDARMTQAGRPERFKQLVLERGYLLSERAGKTVPPEQAVAEVMALLGGGSVSQSAPSQAAAAQQGPPPVIPHVAGRAASPARKAPKNLDEIRKLAAEKALQ